MKINLHLNMNFIQIGRFFCLVLIIFCCTVIIGCKKSPDVVWDSSVKSFDGIWIAEAKTQQWGGPGNNYVATTVALRWTPRLKRMPIKVLELENQSAYPLGSTNVKMKWITNSHIDVTYGDGVQVNFQAIRAAGLDITAHPSTGTESITNSISRCVALCSVARQGP